MKKIIVLALVMLVCASVAMAQTYTQATGTPITGRDKLGAHQNGGRGCVGCHAPHSGARGNGGTLQWDIATQTFKSVATVGDSGDDALWGQDLGPIVALNEIKTGTGGGFPVEFADFETKPRIKTGVVMCLSCHDGNVARGAMMTNESFEQKAGLLPQSYGTQPIPTLLGYDGGTTVGNYTNDHPIGPEAKVNSSIRNYVTFNADKTRLVASGAFAGSNYEKFRQNYGLPVVIGARTGAGFAVEKEMASSNDAYVVCTTCHTPHSMYTASASAINPTSLPDGNPIANSYSGTYPSFFFIAAPYNPSAEVADGTKASSATQFCRQCHFTGAGGSNEGSSIYGIATAF